MLVTHISPDGGQIATIETITETLAPFPGGPADRPPRPRTCSSPAPTAATATRSPRSTVTTNWLAGRLLRDEAADEAPFEQRICLLATNTDFPCERLVAARPRARAVGSRRLARRQPGGGDAGAGRRDLGRDRDLLGGDRAARARRQLRAERQRARRGRPTAARSRSPAATAGCGSRRRPAPPGSERRILASRASSRCGCAAAARRCGSRARGARGPARACGSGWPTRRAARASVSSAGPAGAGARSPRAGRRVHDDVLGSGSRRGARRVARAGPRAGRPRRPCRGRCACGCGSAGERQRRLGRGGVRVARGSTTCPGVNPSRPLGRTPGRRGVRTRPLTSRR